MPGPAMGDPTELSLDETIRVRIPRTRRQTEKMKRVVVYFQLEFSFHGQGWATEMRYSQLYKIHNDFEDMLPMEQRPVFPPKRVANTNPVFIENRRAMLETWLQAVLQQPEALVNKELHEVIAVPGTVMAWFRKHSKLLERKRGGGGGAQMSTSMLTVDLEFSDGRDVTSGSRVDDLGALPVALSVARGSADLLRLCRASPLAGIHAHATMLSPGVRAVLGDHELSAAVGKCADLMPAWVTSEPIVPPGPLPAFDPAVGPRLAPGRLSPSKRGSGQSRGRHVPSSMYSVRVSRRRQVPDGPPEPFQMTLGRSDPHAEYAVITELASEDPLFLSGLHTGDLIVAVDNRPLRHASTDRVREVLQGAADPCEVRFLRSHEVKVIDVERATRAEGGAAGVRLPLGATLISEENIYTGDWSHRFRRVTPKGPGALAGLQDGDLLLEVGPESARSLTTDDMRARLKNMETIVIARSRPPQAISVVKITSNPAAKVSEGFMCPVCMKDLGAVEDLIEHFSIWHPDMGPLPGSMVAALGPPQPGSAGPATQPHSEQGGKEVSAGTSRSRTITDDSGGKGSTPRSSRKTRAASQSATNPELVPRERSNSIGRKRFLIAVGPGARQFVSTSVKRGSGSDGAFGFSLGSPTANGELYVTKVASGHSRGSSKLQVADIVTHVDGNDIRGLDHDAAIDLILRANSIVLGIQRVEGGIRGVRAQKPSAAAAAAGYVLIAKRRDDIGQRIAAMPKNLGDLLPLSVTLTREIPDESFGFGLSTLVGGQKIICNVTPNGFAAKTLKVGDILDTVNGVKLQPFGHESAIDLISNALELTLGVRRAANKMRRRRTDQSTVRSASTRKVAMKPTTPPIGFQGRTGAGERPRAQTVPVHALAASTATPQPTSSTPTQGGVSEGRTSVPQHTTPHSQALSTPQQGQQNRPAALHPRLHALGAAAFASPATLAAASPVSAFGTPAPQWANIRFCRYCGKSLQGMAEADKVTHLETHPEFQRPGGQSEKKPSTDRSEAATPVVDSLAAAVAMPPWSSGPVMPSSSDPDAWWAGGYAKDYIAEVVSRSSAGDFLLRDGLEDRAVLLVINDYGRAKQSVIKMEEDGRCRVSGIPDAFPNLAHLIHVMRLRRQYSKVKKGASFVLGMPAGNIFSKFDFRVWSIGQTWT